MTGPLVAMVTLIALFGGVIWAAVSFDWSEATTIVALLGCCVAAVWLDRNVARH